jgi:hypothetical protein
MFNISIIVYYVWKLFSTFLQLMYGAGITKCGNWTMGRTPGIRFPARIEFFFAVRSIPALGPTQPPIQWLSDGFLPEIKRPKHHLHLLPRLKMRGGIPHVPTCLHCLVLTWANSSLQLMCTKYCLRPAFQIWVRVLVRERWIRADIVVVHCILSLNHNPCDFPSRNSIEETFPT